MTSKRLIVTLLALLLWEGAFARYNNSEQPDRSNMDIALRSNLLVPALNIGAELPLGTRWSVAADYYFPWLKMGDKNKNCFQLLGWNFEGRYWFGKERTEKMKLLGHSVGVYSAAGYYDFERNYKGTQGEFITAGADYTYSMAIGKKKKKINLEFTLAVGYIHSWGRPYHVISDYGPLFKDDTDLHFDYFGPTKAAVSLVVPIRFGRKQR